MGGSSRLRALRQENQPEHGTLRNDRFDRFRPSESKIRRRWSSVEARMVREFFEDCPS